MSDQNARLARMMRECALYVEQNKFHPTMYQVIGDLHSYAGKHGDSKGQLANKQSSGGVATWTALGKKLQNFGISTTTSSSSTDKAARQATSSKNADRIRQDLDDSRRGGGSAEDDSWTSWWTGSGGGDEKPAAPAKPGKPAFQRPTNPKSTLVANGWIEQLRRSKMRVVWKDVLASLVQGRKPNEETTLWIQREVMNSTTGKAELEALHQIPIKWLQEIKYLDYYGDYRFAIKVYNVSDEFVFRCADEESAQNWILTLRSIKADESGVPAQQIEQPKQKVESNAPFDEGGSISESKSVSSAPASGGVQPGSRSTSNRSLGGAATKSDPPAGSARAHSPLEPSAEEPERRMTVKEMRAIAHGAGVSTQGMERSDLQRVVAQITGAAHGAGMSSSLKAKEEQHRQEVESARRRQELAHQESMQRKADDEALDQEKDAEKRRQLEEAQRQRVANARKKAEDEELKRQALVNEEKRRAQALAEEHRRVEEQRRQAEEHRRHAAAAEEQRRRAAEQHAAEQRRRQEEERVRAQQQYQQQQQAWQQQQWQQQQAAAQQAAAQQRQQAAQHAQWQHWQQQQQQQQQHQNPFNNAQHQSQRSAAGSTAGGSTAGGSTAGGSTAGSTAGSTNGGTSNADQKYTKMAAEANDGEEKVAAVKRNILVHWALQPPQLQHLRPIADLLTGIHKVFPPAFGVAGHDYFAKWKAIARTELVPVGSGPDEEKLKKAVRKLRFFLHPDKLPRDLNEEQTFMCKMLWDISSDAWEEYKKRHEELDWIQK